MGGLTLHIHVDGTLCSGQGRCYTVAPDLLEPDDEGFVTLKGSSMEVPVGQEQSARRACAACPEDAITLSED
jgi:ferredoxin